jgi:hypothetical protein
MVQNRTMGITWVVLFALCFFLLGGTRVSAGDKEDILGRWNDAGGAGTYWRFNKDGTYMAYFEGGFLGLLSTTLEGKYEFADRQHIQLTWKDNKVEWKYKLNGDTLELKAPSGAWERYRRSK